MADGGYEPTEEESRQMELEHATRLAEQGYTRALDDIRAQDAWNAAQAQEAANQAAQEAAQAQAWANQVTNESARQAAQQAADYAAEQARQIAQATQIQQTQRAAEQAAVDTAIKSGTEYVSPGNAEEIRQANLVKDTPFGVGMGQAIGRPYELLNADGEPYKRFDARGNLTEFVDRLTGKWAKASDVKPVGSVFDDIANKFITEYEYGGRKYTPNEGSGGLAKAAFMDPYSKDTGGFFGEGGLGKIATLVAAGFAPYALPYLATAGLGAAGAAGVYGGLTTVGKGLLEGKSFEDSLVDGLKSGAISAFTAGVLSGLPTDAAAGLGEEFGDIINAGASEEGIGKFLDAVKESGGQFTGDVSNAGSDMTFDELVSSTGATQGKGGIEDYYDAAKQISKTNEDDVYEALKKYFAAGYEGAPVPGSETAGLTTIGATQEQINDLEAMGIKLPKVSESYSKWHEFADDPSSMVIPPVTNQDMPFVDLTKDGVLSYNDLLDYLTETVGQYGTISKDGVVTELPDYIKTNINNLLGTSAGIAGLASLIKGAGTIGQTQPIQGGGVDIGTGPGGIGGGQPGGGSGTGEGGTGEGGSGTGGTGGGGGAGGAGGGSGGGTGDGAGESDADLELKRQNLSQALSAQIQPVTVKPPPVAKIDYVYDIGGDSIFATPKQESLMPSPFEQNPDAVDGVMPRYQYYDPQGGYQYAEGGSIDDLYELLRGK